MNQIAKFPLAHVPRAPLEPNKPETVHVYGKKPDETGDCPFCNRTKDRLRQLGIPFTYEELTPVQRQNLYDRLGLAGADRTVPQVMITDCEGRPHRVGGYRELVTSRIESLFGHVNPKALPEDDTTARQPAPRASNTMEP